MFSWRSGVLIRVMCFFAAVIASSSPLLAQGKCTLQLLPGYSLSTYREHVGDRFSYRDVQTEETYKDEEYGVTYKPIYARGGGAPSGAGSFECRNPENGRVVGVRVSAAATSLRTRGVVSTNPLRENLAGVRMWDHTLFPVTNETKESRVSDVGYWARGRSVPWSVDAYGLVNFLNTEAVSLSFGGGLRVAGMKLYREEGQTQTAFVFDYFGPDRNLINTITITGRSETSVRVAVGPELNTRLQLNRGKANLRFDASFAFLAGSVREASIWHDVDDMHLVTGYTAKTFADSGRAVLLNGLFTHETKHWTMLPTRDLSLALSYPLAKRVSLVPTVVYSSWNNLPAPPRWSAPGLWRLSDGSGFREQAPGRASTLSLLAGLSVKF